MPPYRIRIRRAASFNARPEFIEAMAAVVCDALRQAHQMVETKDPVVEVIALGTTYRPGEKEDFDRLYRATYQRIFATLMTILRNPAAAEDATQEAYLRAFRAWKSWKQDAPAEAWIYRIALNVAFSHRRRERLHEVGEVIRRLGRAREPDPSETAQPDLMRELRALPPKQAAALVLRHLHGFSNREIAAALGIPEKTVASRLAAAKVRLRGRLGDQISVELGTSTPSAVSLDK